MELYQLFGSKNSLDYDIIIFVDSIPDIIDDAHKVCKQYNAELSKIYSDKPLNCNLAIVKDGIVVDCFKGTPDELTNSLFYTYKNHTQPFECQITHVVERNIDQKVLRVSRSILSFFSRTDLRTIVKPALRGNLYDKVPVISKIDFTKEITFEKRESTVDIYKVIAFQFGQLFSLLDGYESNSYSKSGIIESYPKLSNMLNRLDMTGDDKVYLNECRDRLLSIISDRIHYMSKLVE